METYSMKWLFVALVYSRLCALASPMRVTLNIERSANHSCFVVVNSNYQDLPFTAFYPLPGYEVIRVKNRHGTVWRKRNRTVTFVGAFVYYSKPHDNRPFFCVQVRLAIGRLVSFKDRSCSMEEMMFSLAPFIKNATQQKAIDERGVLPGGEPVNVDIKFLSDILEKISREELRKRGWAGTINDDNSPLDYSEMEGLDDNQIEDEEEDDPESGQTEDDPMEGTSSSS